MVRAMAGDATPATAIPAPARPGMAKGLRTDARGASGSSWGTASSHAARNAIGSAAATRANQRQRGDGREPVGVSSRMNVTRLRPGTKVAEARVPSCSAHGSVPGRARRP
jgi:hypothetical protein